MKLSTIDQEKKEFTCPEIVQAIALDCFLHHKIKLIRNWGSTDETDELCYKDATLLQFTNRACSFQLALRPKEGKVMIMHTTNRGRKLYIYFVRKIQAMLTGTYKPNF
jgi:hypothetical protein